MRAGTLLYFLFAVPVALRAAGTTSAEFLKNGAGARGAAMGDAQAAVAADVFALHWNPAGLSRLKAPEAGFMHQQWLEGARQQQFAAALPLRAFGTVAVGVNSLSVDELNSFDAQGALVGALTSRATAFSAGWGRKLWGGLSPGGLSAGAAAKLIQERIGGVSGDGFAVDLGLEARPWGAASSRRPWLRRFSAGLALKNLGSGPRFDRDAAPLPWEAVAGLGYAHFISGDMLTLAADARRTEGEDTGFSVGAEYWHRGFAALRAGWRSGADDGEGFRAGAGFRLRRMQVDYAWSVYGRDLEDAHRVSVSFRFGPAPADFAEDLFRHHLDEGRRQFEAGQYGRAALSLDEALKISPRDAEAEKLLLECGRKMEAAP